VTFTLMPFERLASPILSAFDTSSQIYTHNSWIQCIFCAVPFFALQGMQVRQRLCTIAPWLVHLRCRPSKSSRTSLFLQRLPRSASGSPLHCWHPSIFGCWPPGVELPATGGYVGTVSGDLRTQLKTFLFTEIRLI